MKKLNLLENAKQLFTKTGLKVQKHSPEILIAAGVVGIATSTVLACKATLKVKEQMEQSDADMALVDKYVEEHGYSEHYTEQDEMKDRAIVTTQRVVKLVTLYAPAALLGAVSVSAILYSHKIMSGRNAALASTLTAVTANFRDYRKRVEDKFGTETEREIRMGSRQEKTTVIDGDGNETEVDQTVNEGNPEDYSIYARCFDESCRGWEPSSEYNLLFLKTQQNYFNDMLKSKGHLFLNEVYNALGFPPTKIGQQVGWVYSEDNPVGDNYVDLGIYDLYNERSRAFVNGHERSIWLDFNVDGVIWECL